MASHATKPLTSPHTRSPPPASQIAQPLPLYREAAAQRLVPFSRSWHTAKVILRSVSLVFSIVLVGLAAASGTGPQYQYYRNFDWALALPAGLCCGLWDTAEFVTLWLRRRTAQRGIHPGAHVGLDLGLWLLCASMATALVVAPYRNFSSYYYSSAYYYDGDRQLNVACVTVLFILCLIHLVLFGRACKETAERNKSKTHPSMVYIPHGGAPFATAANPSGVVYIESFPATHVHETGEEGAPLGEDLDDPPHKEVIPGFVR